MQKNSFSETIFNYFSKFRFQCGRACPVWRFTLIHETKRTGLKFFQETRRNFCPLIMLDAFCTRLAPFFDIPEVELESVFNAFGRVVSGDAHLRCAALVRTSTFLCVQFLRMLNVECRMWDLT